jgi:hypothetical protein
MRLAEHVACEIRNAYTILVGKLKWKDHSEDLVNIKLYLGEIFWESADWMHLAHDKEL